ncbi:hypothetical protein BS50DRAFT_4219 [Corynespora cassiicola Philippines]|uniref:Uncharacterized protein n=1 Tax=Corynespora cassiicola Philippines TaxID=1448308 RepID=A0A2T2P8G2_CORCC|nr:hypothetical protein BS50DRAFT_4219 [Corynespora cassiicola Philippines]
MVLHDFTLITILLLHKTCNPSSQKKKKRKKRKKKSISFLPASPSARLPALHWGHALRMMYKRDPPLICIESVRSTFFGTILHKLAVSVSPRSIHQSVNQSVNQGKGYQSFCVFLAEPLPRDKKVMYKGHGWCCNRW